MRKDNHAFYSRLMEHFDGLNEHALCATVFSAVAYDAYPDGATHRRSVLSLEGC